MKEFKSAPLPFMGQKRMFANEFKKVLNRFDHASMFVDLFGGSGLLSHLAKRTVPDAQVVYNDFDNYRRRLDNIARTNSLLADLRDLVVGCPRAKVLPIVIKAAVLKRIEIEEQSGFVDYITLSSSLLFSMKYVLNITDLGKEAFYNNVRKADYDCTGYLDGITVTCEDYKTLFERYKDVPGVVFLVDPPYLSTEVGTYNMSWKLSDFLDVQTVLSDNSYIFFTSNKSEIIELCQWIEDHKDFENPFIGADKSVFNARMNYNSTYLDMMLYRQESRMAA